MNRERIAPPLSPVDGLTITMNSMQVQLTTDFGLTVRFDGKSRAGKKWSLSTHIFLWLVRLIHSSLSFHQRSYCPAPTGTTSEDCVETTMGSPAMSIWSQMGQWSETWIHLETAGGSVIDRETDWRSSTLLTQSTGSTTTWALIITFF